MRFLLRNGKTVFKAAMFANAAQRRVQSKQGLWLMSMRLDFLEFLGLRLPPENQGNERPFPKSSFQERIRPREPAQENLLNKSNLTESRAP